MKKSQMKSFTLIELLVVVITLAILARLAMPAYLRVVSRSRESEAWLFLGAIRTSELRYYNEHEEIFTKAPGELDIDSTTAAVNLFTYKIISGGGIYTAVACPKATCFGCRILCLDTGGIKGQTSGSCGACP